MGTRTDQGAETAVAGQPFREARHLRVAMGTPMRTVATILLEDGRRTVKAIQVGGPLGGHRAGDAHRRDDGGFRVLQEGGIFARARRRGQHSRGVPDDRLYRASCSLRPTKCGKCFPCRLGSTRGKELAAKAERQQLQIDPDASPTCSRPWSRRRSAPLAAACRCRSRMPFAILKTNFSPSSPGASPELSRPREPSLPNMDPESSVVNELVGTYRTFGTQGPSTKCSTKWTRRRAHSRCAVGRGTRLPCEGCPR